MQEAWVFAQKRTKEEDRTLFRVQQTPKGIKRSFMNAGVIKHKICESCGKKFTHIIVRKDNSFKKRFCEDSLCISKRISRRFRPRVTLKNSADAARMSERPKLTSPYRATAVGRHK